MSLNYFDKQWASMCPPAAFFPILMASVILFDLYRGTYRYAITHTVVAVLGTVFLWVLMAKKELEAAEAKKLEVAQHKTSLQQLNQQLADTEKRLLDDIIKLPNLPNDDVPDGKTPAENVVVRTGIIVAVAKET